MRFFFDRNISVHLARMLARYDRDNTIDHQDDDGRFAHNTGDIPLIETVGSDTPKSIWVTADVSQWRRVPAERLALIESGMHAIFFRAGFNEQSPRHQAIKIITVWDSIVTACKGAQDPTAFEVSNKMHADKVERICLMRDLGKH